jgi:hypothetical protein
MLFRLVGTLAKAIGRGLSRTSEGVLDKPKKYRLQCTIFVKLDERTCKICRPKHKTKVVLPQVISEENLNREINNMIGIIRAGGTPYMSQGVPVLPKFHPRCRCTIDIEPISAFGGVLG